MMSAIITGPTGAIGMALIEELFKQSVEVYAVIRPQSPRKDSLLKFPKLHIVECALDNFSQMPKQIGSSIDVFYHFAWENTFGAAARNDMDCQIRNIQYTIDAVRVAKELGCGAFIGAGSQAEYGRVEGMLSADTPAFPENGYGMAKLCAGNMSRVECKKLGIRHIWTRILSVYGPYDGNQTLMMSLIQKLLQGEKPACTAGEQLWDYLYSKDIAKALYLLGDNGKDGAIYPLGSGQAHPLKYFIEKARDGVNDKLPIGFGEIAYAPQQVMHLCADISALQNDTGFVPSYSFDRGIKETIIWIQENLASMEENCR